MVSTSLAGVVKICSDVLLGVELWPAGVVRASCGVGVVDVMMVKTPVVVSAGLGVINGLALFAVAGCWC